jgi:hypothetical protein
MVEEPLSSSFFAEASDKRFDHRNHQPSNKFTKGQRQGRVPLEQMNPREVPDRKSSGGGKGMADNNPSDKQERV